MCVYVISFMSILKILFILTISVTNMLIPSVLYLNIYLKNEIIKNANKKNHSRIL